MSQSASQHCKAKPVVMHLIDTTGPGGAETVFVQLADCMREQGFDSVVVIRGKGWVHDALVARGLSPIILDAKGSFNFAYLQALAAVVKQHNVSLIHSHLLGSNVYAAMVGLLARCPVVATYHGMVDVNPNERFRRIKRLAMRAGINRYVVVSQSLQKNILEQRLLNPTKTKVIYNGIDVARYHRSDSTAIREQLQLPANATLIGSLGNIRPAKAYDLLVAAAAEVVKQNPNAHFVIAGDPKKSLMAELQTQIAELGLERHIHFLGFCDDSAAFLAQLDVFVLCSRSEGFSISTIEAMAAGLPVIASRCGGPEEIINHQHDGWLVENDNAAALAEGISHLLANNELAQRLALAAKSRVEAAFSGQKMLADYAELYQPLIK